VGGKRPPCRFTGGSHEIGADKNAYCSSASDINEGRQSGSRTRVRQVEVESIGPVPPVQADAAHADAIAIKVEDNGRGVASELADKIFDAYQTTKPRGMGLGWRLTQRIVQRHAGRLWWEPVRTGGARL
jgi:nitrogen fixation/metabolism regulation signal transduction histidine kinase